MFYYILLSERKGEWTGRSKISEFLREMNFDVKVVVLKEYLSVFKSWELWWGKVRNDDLLDSLCKGLLETYYYQWETHLVNFKYYENVTYTDFHNLFCRVLHRWCLPIGEFYFCYLEDQTQVLKTGFEQPKTFKKNHPQLVLCCSTWWWEDWHARAPSLGFCDCLIKRVWKERLC